MVIHSRSLRRKLTIQNPVVHAPMPSPARVISPLRTLFDRFSPCNRVYSRAEPFIHIDPFCFHTSVAQSFPEQILSPRASTARMYLLLTYFRASFTCMLSCALLRMTFRMSRVYYRTDLCRVPGYNRSSLRAKTSGQRVHNIARRALSCCSRRNWLPQIVSPS